MFIATRPKHSPRGYLMLATLATLGVISSILFSIIPTAMQFRRQTRNDLLRLQSEYLVQGLHQHAMYRRSLDDQYTGETFQMHLSAIPNQIASDLNNPQNVDAIEERKTLTQQPWIQPIYQANGEIKYIDNELTIHCTLTPIISKPLTTLPELVPASPRMNSPTIASEQPSTSLLPHVRIERSWKLPH